MNAALNLNQVADYRWHDLGSDGSPADLRREIVAKCPSFQLVWDIADAHKHRKISRSDRMVTSAGQAETVHLGYGEAEFGVDEWGSPPLVVIYANDGSMRRLGPVIETVLACWEEEVG